MHVCVCVVCIGHINICIWNIYPLTQHTIHTYAHSQSVDNKRSLFTESLIATGLAPSDYRFLTLPASLLASSESVGNPTASTLAPPPKRRYRSDCVCVNQYIHIYTYV
jgi:hypothetical protein